MFDVFYIGNNSKLVEQIPFAKQVSSPSEIIPNTKMYWFVEPNVEILDYTVFDFRPPAHDQSYEHVWKCNGTTYGGVILAPVSDSTGTKQVDNIVCRKIFDILYDFTPGDYFESHPYATHVWCVDPEYKLSDNIDWAPDSFEPDYIHSFHLRGQLEHKYPEKEGGIKLYPKNWATATIKFHSFLDAGIRYPDIRVEDVSDYTQRDHLDDDLVWLIDSDYQIDPDSLDWLPNPFEQSYIHCFRMRMQLAERYPETMGGIRLVPKHWRTAETKIHSHCVIKDIQYDVFFLQEGEFNSGKYEECASRSKTDWFWVVDKDYEFNGSLVFVPSIYEQEFIHVFKVPGMLEYRYTLEIHDAWDNRCGGVRLVNRNFDITKQKYQEGIVPVKYDVFYSDNVKNYKHFSDRSKTHMYWVIDSEYQIDDLSYVAPKHEQQYILNFQTDQLKHKYPEKEGGIYLVPKHVNDTTQIKYKEMAPGAVKDIRYDVFSSETEGAQQTKTDWFWVISPNVKLLPNFALDYIPEPWDAGKTHVWQKLNPITRRQYDYAGVMLCPKVPQEKGRPKYIREPACVQKEFPVYHLQPAAYNNPLSEAYRRFSQNTDNNMFWVVDAHTKLAPDFKFDYYPTQWDQKYVHVFQHEDGDHKHVRLIPVGLFEEWDYTDEQIANNSFENLKLINTVASLRTEWPIIQLTAFNKDLLAEDLTSYRDGYETGKSEPFVWILDPGVSRLTSADPIISGFMPKATDVNKVHCWQRLNNVTNQVHSYGGVRLWPTSYDFSKLTSDHIRLNKLKDVFYVRTPGSVINSFDVVFISYNDSDAEQKYSRLVEHVSKIKTLTGTPISTHWIKDIDGIFNAHKTASDLVNSKMFWVVDADAEIVSDFDFSYVPDVYDEQVVHVWDSLNPVTDAQYGYGGIKLFPTQLVREATSWGLDFTTGLSSRFKSMRVLSCVTRFNTDQFSTWRSAFRECVKLTLKTDTESLTRLQTWLNPKPDAQYSTDAKLGAEAGNRFAIKYRDGGKQLSNINDYSWLRSEYERTTVALNTSK
jgi:hypothetical protein